MAIKSRYDPVRAIGQLSVLAGKAEAQQKEAAINREMALRAAQMQHQKEMMQFEAKLKLQTQQRAMEWEYQKMEMRSQNDFLLAEERNKALYMREVAKQLKEMDEYDQAKKTIMDDETLTDANRMEALQRIELKKLGYPGVYPRPETNTAKKKAYAAMARMITEKDKEIPVSHLRGMASPEMIAKTETKVLDAEIAKAILAEAGGDKEKARQIAISRGYKL